MTTFLWNTSQGKDVAKIQLVTQSAGNLVYCLNSLLKAGADIASKDDDIQEKVNICHLVLYCIIIITIITTIIIIIIIIITITTIIITLKLYLKREAQ